jgi:hypothetical protein
MAEEKLSGHARLKQTLVLRDALAAELGLDLTKLMGQLYNVEDNMGAARALDEGKYLDALASLCQGDRDRLARLDLAVRTACGRVRLAPRYAQYLALLLFAYWNEAQLEDRDAFLVRLNARLQSHPSRPDNPERFTETDLQTAAFSGTGEFLQMAAFWMATAAGKTHVLHACLALLEDGHHWDRIFIVTPSESLTRQHAEKLRKLQEWDVFAYPMDGDAAALGNLPREAVIVIDINKLADQKQGNGVTVPTQVFKEGRNLVFVDEGHKGQTSEKSAWKKLQEDLAGIDTPDPHHRGLLIEFSATFGQVAEAEHAFSRYAKTIVFDYAYDQFHKDLYGKDFWHVKLDGRGDASTAASKQTLTAALLSFWHQVASFKSSKSQTAAKTENLALTKPLWVLLGLSVIGGKNKSDQEQTSDVVDVLRYLSGILQGPEHLKSDLQNLLDIQVNGAVLLPLEVRAALAATKWETLTLAERILSDVFGWQHGDRPVFRLLKGASGELGLGLLRADETHYFGVVNVGDAGGLKKSLETMGLPVEDDALSASLFEGLSRHNSPINLLIGSRRFAEGWDNYRASSLTLLRLGQGEGSLIIQMFGRVVRFAGRNGDGRRLRHPPPELKPLQTAYVYGLRSKYLETFLAGLYENGVPKIRQQTCPVHITLPIPSFLYSVADTQPAPSEFTVSLAGDSWLRAVNQVKLSLGVAVEISSLGQDGLDTDRGKAGQDLTKAFKVRLAAVNEDAIYREMVNFKRQQRWWNFAFDRSAIRAALHSDRYEIFGLPSVLELRSGADLARLHRIAATLVRRLFEKAYKKQESSGCRYGLIRVEESGIPKKYHKEIQE